MRRILVCTAFLLASSIGAGGEQGAAKTLVAVFAHPDDEGAVSPVLARYAREGAQVYLIVATDGAAGGQQTSVATGPDLARVRADEARCAADALGIRPPILLGFPDGRLGAYLEEPVRLFRLTQRLHEELQRLRPDAVITWGPDGGRDIRTTGWSAPSSRSSHAPARPACQTACSTLRCPPRRCVR